MPALPRRLLILVLLALLPLQGFSYGPISALRVPAERTRVVVVPKAGAHLPRLPGETELRACLHLQHGCCYHSAWATPQSAAVAIVFAYRASRIPERVPVSQFYPEQPQRPPAAP